MRGEGLSEHINRSNHPPYPRGKRIERTKQEQRLNDGMLTEGMEAWDQTHGIPIERLPNIETTNRQSREQNKLREPREREANYWGKDAQ